VQRKLNPSQTISPKNFYSRAMAQWLGSIFTKLLKQILCRVLDLRKN